jgi:hypothetical protein
MPGVLVIALGRRTLWSEATCPTSPVTARTVADRRGRLPGGVRLSQEILGAR